MIKRDSASMIPSVGKKRNLIFALGILTLSMLLRISGMIGDILWVDEAESAINGLTILECGLPRGDYLGIPVYENTLTEPLETDPEYAYRDSSYSLKKNVAVYHGWLPLYSIALSQALFGLQPDLEEEGQDLRPRHSREEIFIRTLAPRVPALVFSLATCVVLFFLMRHLAGRTAALASLTWFGLAGMPAWFSTQARYYSLTMLMVVAVAYAYHRTVKWGNWKSFVLLGLYEGMLFHTHQLSAVIFAGAALFWLPVLIRHDKWFAKSMVAVLIAGSMTIPWALWSGFFETASTVPNVYHLFDSLADWVRYAFERPKSLLLLLVLTVILLGLFFFPRHVPEQCREAFSRHRYYYLFLIYWMALVYLAFHTLVPAASYFTDRLTLMMLMPFVMLNGLLWGDLSRVFVRRWQGLSAVIFSFISILLLHRPALFYGFRTETDQLSVNSVFDYLEQNDFAPDTRIFATPSNQLTYTYYTGLPIQSTIPVRKSFFDNYPGGVVILDTRTFPQHLDGTLIEAAAERNDDKLSESEVKQVQRNLWKYMVYQNDLGKGLPVPDEPVRLSAFEAGLLNQAEEFSATREKLVVEELTNKPIFNRVRAADPDEYWKVFFLRFLNYENYTRGKTNYYGRIEQSEVSYLPASNIVAYWSPRPAKNPSR
jgi:hypothetical protein